MWDAAPAPTPPVQRHHISRELFVRVAIVNLTSGGLSGGYKKYLEQLVPRIAVHPQISQLEVLSPKGMKYARSRHATYWEWPSTDRITGYRRLRHRLLHLQPDVVFIPTARLISTDYPTVVMVRNMEPLVAPFAGNSISEAIKNVGRRATAWRTCRRSTRIIAVSSFVRDFLVKEWNIPASKIAIVTHGVERPLVDSQIPPLAGNNGRFGAPFFFAAGSIRPARGLEDAIDAMEILRDRNIPCTLVIAGDVGDRTTSYFRSLADRIETKSLQERVLWAGELSASQMAWCYSHCAAFLMTSRVEACPNTALEALSYGAECISTTDPPMPDFFGAHAAYYEAGRGDMLATAMLEVLALDPSTRDNRSNLNKSKVHEMTWENTTAATVEQLTVAANTR